MTFKPSSRIKQIIILVTFFTFVFCEINTGITEVYLTVSSLISGGDRRLELNWRGSDPDAKVALYDGPPDINRPPLMHVNGNHAGYFRTRYRFPEKTFTAPKLNLTDQCLGFWIAVIKNEQVQLQSCIRGRPYWMSDMRSTIANLSLLDLMIPGSHNAGCYAPYDSSDDNVFSRYLYTQEENIFNQLAYGIRYLDLRVAYHTTRQSEDTFWITHSNFRTEVSVRDVIKQVKDFLQATNEIVIMDFHRFVTGFKGRRAGERHVELLRMLGKELGHYMIPVAYSTRASLDLLWSTDKRLYIGYAEKALRSHSRYLFPAVKHLWGDVDDIDELWTYLNDTVCENSGSRLTSAMVQLTPTTTGVLFNTYGGLRSMASLVNRPVVDWFRDNWQDCANIISTDFILGNNIIELAIATNSNRSHRAEENF